MDGFALPGPVARAQDAKVGARQRRRSVSREEPELPAPVTQRTRILRRGVDGGPRKRICAEGSRQRAGATARLRMPDGAKGTASEVGDKHAGWRRNGGGRR